MEEITKLVLELAVKYPWLVSVLTLIGALRVINKPLFYMLNEYTKYSSAQWDNELLNKIEQSKVYKAFCWLLDLTASIKPPSKEK